MYELRMDDTGCFKGLSDDSAPKHLPGTSMGSFEIFDAEAAEHGTVHVGRCP